MKIYLSFVVLFLLLTATVGNARETDYLALMAEESEIKAIAVVTNVQRMSLNADGTFKRVTFKRQYAVTPFTPVSFVAGCKTMESRWQKRTPGMVYFEPKKGQLVYVTASTNGGAITSYTLLNPQLEKVIKQDPQRLTYSRGQASFLPEDEY